MVARIGTTFEPMFQERTRDSLFSSPSLEERTKGIKTDYFAPGGQLVTLVLRLFCDRVNAHMMKDNKKWKIPFI